MRRKFFRKLILIVILIVLLLNQSSFFLAGYAKTKEENTANTNNINNSENTNNSENISIDIDATNETSNEVSNEEIQQNQEGNQESDVSTLALDADQRARGELVDLLDTVVLKDQDGNEVKDSINPNNKYTLELDFQETPGLQMELNEDGTITYQLPSEFRLEGQIVDADLFNEQGIKVGTYSIGTDGNVKVQFDKVDENGNPSENYFPDNCSDADFRISLTGQFTLTDTSSDHFHVDFGNEKSLDFPIDSEYFIDIEKTNDWGTNPWDSGYVHDIHQVYYSVKVSPKTDVKNLYVEDILDEKLEFQGEKQDVDDPWRALNIYYTFPDGTKKETVISLFEYPDTIYLNDDKADDPDNSNQITIDKEKLKEWLIIEEQPDGTTKIRFNLRGKNSSEEIEEGTEIVIVYYATLNEKADEEIRKAEGDGYDFKVNNKAVVHGTDVNSEKQITDDTELDTDIKSLVLTKYGETTTIQTDQGGKTVVRWIINIGDGGTSLKNVKIIDESLTEGMHIMPNDFVFKLSFNHNKHIPDKEVSYDELESKDSLIYTVDDDYGYAHIEFYALYDFQFSGEDVPIFQDVKNKIRTEGGDLGKKETTATSSIGSDIPTTTKTMEPYKEGDTELTFKIHHSIPKSFFNIPNKNNWRWYSFDNLDCLWNQSIFYKGEQKAVSYKAKFSELKSHFENDSKIYISDESKGTFSKKPITFASNDDEWKNGKDKYIVGVDENPKNDYYINFCFSDLSVEIPDMLGMDIEYTIPLSIPVDCLDYDTGELLFTGKLEDYSGITFTNHADVVYYNNGYEESKYFPGGTVDFTIGSKLKKSFDFDYNEAREIVSNIVKFDIIINEKSEDLDKESETIKLKDTFSPNLVLLQETLELYEYNPGTGKYDIKIDEFGYSYTETGDDEDNVLTITVPDQKNLKLIYNARAKKTTDETAPKISNLAELEGIPSSKSKTEFVFDILDNSAYVGGTTSGQDVTIIKYGKGRLESEKTPLSDVMFELYSITAEESKSLLTTLTTGDNGKIELKGLAVGKYELVEKKVTKGYNLLSKPISIEVKEDKTVEVSENKYIKHYIDENNLNIIEVINLKSIKLPMTGGKGDFIYVAVGVVLVIYSIRLAKRKTKKKMKRKKSTVNKRK